VLVEVRDVASGASKRPARERLLETARRQQVDAIVVYKLDRWGRSTVDLVNTVNELCELDVPLVSVSDALDMTTSAGRALAGMLAVFAGFERDLIQERVRAGLDAARARGSRLGRPPTATARAGQVLRLRRQGWSQRQIAEELGISNGSVARICKTG
jgi:putative DNA-invertase from lambdoid prophage Rac